MKIDNSNKMREMPVGRLLATMSIPAITSMLIQALYNVVDTYFVAQINPNDRTMINAVGYALPIQIIILAFALGIGIGSNVLVARKLGEQNKKEASDIAKTGLIMAALVGISFFILSFILARPFMMIMSDIPEIIEHGSQYLKIVMMFAIFVFIEMVAGKILQAQGRMIVPMITQIIGAVTNIILDPILIFGLLGFPAMGIKGAAIATVIAQFLAMTFVLIYILTQRLEIDLSLKKLKVKSNYVSEIIKVGMPSMVMNSIAAFTNVALNSIMKSLGSDESANTVLTLYFKMQNFIFMPVFGLTQGGLPILSYNYGAVNKKRYLQTLKLLITTSFIIMLAGLILFQGIPEQLLNIFTKDPEAVKIGIIALRVVSISFLPAAFGIIITNAFQSLGHGHWALAMSFLRQAILLIPSAYLLGRLFGINIVWVAFPFSEFIVTIIFFPYILKQINKVFTAKEIKLHIRESET